ncbi:hypothetical protein WDV91_08410 [Curtobacterium flaccumfaciens pv. flaccumfaciens]
MALEERESFGVIGTGSVRGRVLTHLLHVHPRTAEHHRPGEPAQRRRVVPPPAIRTTVGRGRDAFLLVVADRVDGDAQHVRRDADRHRLDDVDLGKQHRAQSRT